MICGIHWLYIYYFYKQYKLNFSFSYITPSSTSQTSSLTTFCSSLLGCLPSVRWRDGTAATPFSRKGISLVLYSIASFGKITANCRLLGSSATLKIEMRYQFHPTCVAGRVMVFKNRHSENVNLKYTQMKYGNVTYCRSLVLSAIF